MTPNPKDPQADIMGVYRKTQFGSKPSRTRPVTLLCRLGWHKWTLGGIDIEGDITAKCYMCRRCYIYKLEVR